MLPNLTVELWLESATAQACAPAEITEAAVRKVRSTAGIAIAAAALAFGLAFGLASSLAAGAAVGFS